jgi:aspartate aminotransferase
MRFLMQPRDLGHAEPCDFLARNPTALASPAYAAAVECAGCLAMSPAMPDREDLRLAVMVGTISAGAVPDTAMQHAMPELERHIIDVAAVERRRDRTVAAMRNQGYAVESPEAGFYLFPPSPIRDAVEFCGSTSGAFTSSSSCSYSEACNCSNPA